MLDDRSGGASSDDESFGGGRVHDHDDVDAAGGVRTGLSARYSSSYVMEPWWRHWRRSV